MKYGKRIAIVALALTASAALMAEGKADGKGKAAAGGPVSLRTVTMFGGTDPFVPVWDAMRNEFMKANPTVKIVDESGKADDAWKQRLLTDFAVGNDPDVTFFFGGKDQDVLIKAGKVVSVEEIRASYPNFAKNVSDGAFANLKATDGKIYGVPVVGFFEGLYVNRALLASAGVEPPKDWASFEKAVVACRAKGIVPVAVALGHVPNYLIEHFILAAGGIKDHRNSFDSAVPDSWVEGLSYFKKLSDMGAFPVDAGTLREQQAADLFTSGKAAMYADGSWYARNVESLPNMADYDFVAFPQTAKGAAGGAGMVAGFSSGWFVSRKAYDDPAKRDAVVALVSYLTSNDGIGRFAAVNGQKPSAPVSVPVENAFRKKATEVAGRMTETSLPINDRISVVAWNLIKDSVPYLADGSRDPKAVLAEALAENKKK